MRTAVRALLALTLLSSAALVVAPASHAASDRRPTFIVTLRAGEPKAVAAEHARTHGAEVTFVYEHALRGYAARVGEGEIGALARDGRVERIERDGVVRASGADASATWGLDRIDQRDLPTDRSYTWNVDGAGVAAYVIDTGIRSSHADLAGRVAPGYTSIVDGKGTTDCNGHGTHVAGTVGGIEWGVAKAVTLVPVRVLDCNGSGTWSGVIAGVDWVTANAAKPAVANMSLGGGASTSVDDAVKRSIAAGITYVVAAGNDNRDACNYSPARVSEAITVGATTSTDARASYSNHGSCVDLFAPGSAITSAWHTGDAATNTISGTSMASPHAAGAAALHLQGNPSATPLQTRDALHAWTTKGKVTSSSSTNNHLLYTLGIGGGTVQPPPSDSLTLAVRGYKVSGSQRAELTWTGATSADVDVFRNGTRIATTVNDLSHTDFINRKGGGSYAYRVCNAGTSTCSPDVTITF